MNAFDGLSNFGVGEVLLWVFIPHRQIVAVERRSITLWWKRLDGGKEREREQGYSKSLFRCEQGVSLHVDSDRERVESLW